MKISSIPATLGVSGRSGNEKSQGRGDGSDPVCDGLLPAFGGHCGTMTAQQNAQLFHELTQLARSGLPMIRSLEIVGRKPGRGIADCARRLFEALQASGSVSAAFRAANFPESDAAVIEAGEATGRLEQVYQELEQYYSQLATARRNIISKSLYPLLVLHLGVFLLAIPPAILSGGFATYWQRVLPVLFGVYLGLGGLWLGWAGLRQLVARDSSLARIILSIPVLGGFLNDWTAWKYSSVLSLYVRAGGGLFRAVESAGKTCGNALLRKASEDALVRVRQQGLGLAEAFHAEGSIPHVLERALEVGEHSGRLDEETMRAAEIFKERTLGRLAAFGDWTPKLLYLAIVLYIGWQIISMALGVGSSIGAALDPLE
jgi:type II secretory pathway component PulF